MRSAIPWVVVGVAITALLGAAELPLDYLSKYLRTSGRVMAALVGLATPLCSCGALPVAIGLSRSGVSMAIVVSFLTASQSAGLDSAAITVGLLGWSATLFRLVGAVALAVCAGMAVPSPSAPPASTTKESEADKKAPALTTAVTQTKSQSNFLYRFISSAVTNAREVFPMVLLGLMASSAMRLYLPALTGHEKALGEASSQSAAQALFARAFVLISALPLQLCEHTTVTLAAGIQKAGGSPGLAFAFLLSAPATNLPTLLLLLRTQKRESARFATARVVVALAAASLALSYVVDTVGVDMLVQQEAKGGGGSAVGMPKWIIKVSPWIAGLLSFAAAIQVLSEKICPSPAGHHAHHHADPCCDTEKHEKQD